MNKCSHFQKICPIRSKRVIDDMLSMYTLYVIICSKMTETVFNQKYTVNLISDIYPLYRLFDVASLYDQCVIKDIWDMIII